MVEHERPKSPQRIAFEASRAEVVKMRGLDYISTQFAEMMHDSLAVCRQKNRYSVEAVSIAMGTRQKIWEHGQIFGLTSVEVEHACEDEFARREEERRRREHEGDFSS